MALAVHPRWRSRRRRRVPAGFSVHVQVGRPAISPSAATWRCLSRSVKTPSAALARRPTLSPPKRRHDEEAPRDHTGDGARRRPPGVGGRGHRSRRCFRVQANAPQAVVVADPAVEDLPTYGMATSVMVFGKRVTAAGGWLGGSREGATYPVISARAAWHRLVSTPMPRPLIACPEPAPDGSDPDDVWRADHRDRRQVRAVAARGERPSRARAVLAVRRTWLPDPAAVVAVDPRYLGQPRPWSSPGTSDPGSSGSGSGGSGSAAPPARPVPPVAPSTDPDQPPRRNRASRR